MTPVGVLSRIVATESSCTSLSKWLVTPNGITSKEEAQEQARQLQAALDRVS